MLTADRYTAMAYGAQLLLSATNVEAIAGAAVYGYGITPSVFDPPCDAYACVDGVGCPYTYFHASPALDFGAGASVYQKFAHAQETAAYSLEL